MYPSLSVSCVIFWNTRFKLVRCRAQHEQQGSVAAHIRQASDARIYPACLICLIKMYTCHFLGGPEVGCYLFSPLGSRDSEQGNLLSGHTFLLASYGRSWQTELAMHALGKRMFVTWLRPAKHTQVSEESGKIEVMKFEDVFSCASTAPYLQVGPSEGRMAVGCQYRKLHEFSDFPPLFSPGGDHFQKGRRKTRSVIFPPGYRFSHDLPPGVCGFPPF